MRKIKLIDESVSQINDYLQSKDSQLMTDFWSVLEKYGSPEEINQKAQNAKKIDTKIEKLKSANSEYLKDLEWLIEQKEKQAFVKLDDYREKVLGERKDFDDDLGVILEISALQYFSWLIAEAEYAFENQELMPGRFIRVRNMKEQVDDNDLIAVSAAMDIIGASFVETLDTKGTDGSNLHLNGPETITGYFGGIGQPNKYALKWLDEFLYYYTEFGVDQVLNVNSGTILLANFLRQIGVKNEFKISVFMGNDNPYALLSTLILTKLFSINSDDTALTGLNFGNSIDNDSIRKADEVRRAFGFERSMRFEHHITEAYKSIVRQPYNRRSELVEIAKDVKNISAKHEGGEIEVEQKREHPSDILDYFLTKKEIEEKGLEDSLLQNYLDKHESLNITAKELTENGIGIKVAQNLH